MGKAGASKKVVEKEKKKVIEDKTFGLKNKNKSSKVQKYVNTVQTQVNNDGKRKKNADLPPVSKKELEKEKKAEINQLFKPTVVQQKIPVGVDPKSIVCQFFKSGSCTKGAKCKFSHDLEVARKGEKIDIYTDQREMENDLIDNWDEKKLETVVENKQTSENRNLKTEIVCRYFLEAIELKKYGWFWECPNGGDKCMYRHALPPGFVFKKKDKDEDKEEEIPIEQTLEAERKLLVASTPVTLERFLKWKEEKRTRKEAQLQEDKKKADSKAGRTTMSGREMFVFNPDLFIDDEEALDESGYEKQDEIDPNVPHNYVTVTETSIRLTPKLASENGHRVYDDDDDAQSDEKTKEENDDQNSGDEERKNEEEENEQSKREGKREAEEEEDSDKLPEYVNESLFICDDDIPEDDD